MRWLIVVVQGVGLAILGMSVYIATQLFPDFALAMDIVLKAVVIAALICGFIVALGTGWTSSAVALMWIFLAGVGFLLLSLLAAWVNGHQWLEVLQLNAGFSQYAALGYGVAAGAATVALCRLFRTK